MKDFILQNCIDDPIFTKYKKEASKHLFYSTLIFDKPSNAIYGQYGTLHSTSLFSHLALLRMMFNYLSKNKKYSKTFVDLGCGIGVPMIYALKHNWNSVGIEISKGAINCCKANINNSIENNFLNKKSKDKYKLYNKSFFPENFSISKSNSKGQDDFREELNKLYKCNKSKNKHIPKSIIKNADLMYHYQVERRQNILNLFSKFCKENSYLIFVATRDDKFIIPKNVMKIDEYNGLTIYQKKSISKKIN